MKQYFVKIEGKEYVEKFYPDAQCVFCEDIGAYKIDETGIAFCEKCLLENYREVRFED